MAVTRRCAVCNRETPVYRLASLILDGRVAELCPRCVSTEQERVDVPYAPRVDSGAIQPSTSREAW